MLLLLSFQPNIAMETNHLSEQVTMLDKLPRELLMAAYPDDIGVSMRAGVPYGLLGLHSSYFTVWRDAPSSTTWIYRSTLK